jgi:hypothetical protein
VAALVVAAASVAVGTLSRRAARCARHAVM